MSNIIYTPTEYVFKYVDENHLYREVDSITAMPSAYVETGFTGNNNTSIDCKFMWHDCYNYNFAFGTGTSYQGSNLELYNNPGGTAIYAYYNGTATTNASFQAMKPFRMLRQKNVVTIFDENDTVIGTFTNTEATFTCGSTLQIFRINRDNYYTTKPQTCYFFKVWDNDILVRDYVPCIRESDMIAGFYDKVNSNFVTSANDNKLIAGNNVLVSSPTVRHYYKYIWENTNTPVYSNQSEATSGINGVKMNINPSYYYITQNNSGHTMGINNTVGFDLGEYSKNLSYIGFIGVVVSGQYPGIVMTNIECSEDGENWTLIRSSYGGRGDYLSNPLRIETPNNYRFIRFTSSDDDLRYSYGGIYNVRVGYEKRGVTNGTSDDYDYYIDAPGIPMYTESTKVHKYYKLVPWLQPTFSQNTYEYDAVKDNKNNEHIKFEVSASHASQAPWYAFNKSLAANDCWWTNHGVTSESNPCWLQFSSTKKMMFTRLTIMNENTSPENFNHGILQATNNTESWENLTEFYGTNTASFVTHIEVPIAKRKPYRHYRLYFDSSYSTGGVSIQLINFEGYMLNESTSKDYDLVEEYDSFDIDTEPDKTFYKYSGTTPVIVTNEDYDYYLNNDLTFMAYSD